MGEWERAGGRGEKKRQTGREGRRPEKIERGLETERGRQRHRETKRQEPEAEGGVERPEEARLGWGETKGSSVDPTGTHPAAGLVVVQVHEDARALVGAFGVDALPLARVHELLGEAVAVVDVVAAAAPQPVPGQVLGARGAAAAAGGQLALAARAAHGVDHPRGAHRVREGRLAAACGRGRGSPGAAEGHPPPPPTHSSPWPGRVWAGMLWRCSHTCRPWTGTTEGPIPNTRSGPAPPPPALLLPPK